MRISDWSSDVCSSDLDARLTVAELAVLVPGEAGAGDDIGGPAFPPVVEQAASAQAAARASRRWRRCMDMADSVLEARLTLARAGVRVDERGTCTATTRPQRTGPGQSEDPPNGARWVQK